MNGTRLTLADVERMIFLSRFRQRIAESACDVAEYLLYGRQLDRYLDLWPVAARTGSVEV